MLPRMLLFSCSWKHCKRSSCLHPRVFFPIAPFPGYGVQVAPCVCPDCLQALQTAPFVVLSLRQLRCESPESYELWSDALNNALPKDMPTGGAPVPRTENKEKEKDEPGRMQTPESGQPEAEPETSGAAEPEEGQVPLLA